MGPGRPVGIRLSPRRTNFWSPKIWDSTGRTLWGILAQLEMSVRKTSMTNAISS
ncbi:hypothetical protein TNCV_4812481 [Trichonephila clavipes]|nr:hypothetical protein TNCV_4812481 [Trichonephila clavipes]